MVKRRVISQAEVIKAHKLLESVLNKIEGSDLWVYADGYSDLRVAKEIHPDLNDSSIAKMRTSMFGMLRPRDGAPSGDVKALSIQVEAMCAKLDICAEKYTEWVFRHNRLCDTLTVNKIADVRHLKIGETKPE